MTMVHKWIDMNIAMQPGGRTVLGRPVSLVLVVAYKAILGFVEVCFGLAFAGVAIGMQYPGPARFLAHLISGELKEDPNDATIHWFLSHGLPLVLTNGLYLSLAVLIIGLIKLGIAYGIWNRSRRVAGATIILVAFLGIVGVIDGVLHFSWFKVVATVVDFLLLYYLVRVLPRHMDYQTISKDTVTAQKV